MINSCSVKTKFSFLCYWNFIILKVNFINFILFWSS